MLGLKFGQDRSGIVAFGETLKQGGLVDLFGLNVEVFADRLRPDAAIMDMVGIAHGGARKGSFERGQCCGIATLGAAEIDIGRQIVRRAQPFGISGAE